MKNNIQLRTIGKIVLGGEEDTNFILIVDDLEVTGGYYIYLCKNIEMNDCYDGWVLDECELKTNVADYTIDWISNKELPTWI